MSSLTYRALISSSSFPASLAPLPLSFTSLLLLSLSSRPIFLTCSLSLSTFSSLWHCFPSHPSHLLRIPGFCLSSAQLTVSSLSLLACCRGAKLRQRKCVAANYLQGAHQTITSTDLAIGKESKQKKRKKEEKLSHVFIWAVLLFGTFLLKPPIETCGCYENTVCHFHVGLYYSGKGQ